jgi:hypothetical protein
LLNYLPNQLTLALAQRFGKYRHKGDWPAYLRAGIRGGTEWSVLREIGYPAEVLQPRQGDRADHWLTGTSSQRRRMNAWSRPGSDSRIDCGNYSRHTSRRRATQTSLRPQINKLLRALRPPDRRGRRSHDHRIGRPSQHVVRGEWPRFRDVAFGPSVHRSCASAQCNVLPRSFQLSDGTLARKSRGYHSRARAA